MRSGISIIFLSICVVFLPLEGRAINISDLVIVVANSGTSEVADTVVGQTGEEPSLLPEDSEILSDEDLLGDKGGYFHPYLNIYGEWSDNLYNDVDGEEIDNFLTRITPGVWFALPRKKVIPIALNPHNTSPGGLQNQLKESEYTDRFMSYALVGADFKYYSEESDLDDTDVIVEGLLQYNMRGGLSLQVADRYTMAEDVFGFETVDRINERPRFESNFLIATLDWQITEKLNFKFDYINFLLAYDEEIDQFKDRVDNSFDFYGTFDITEKTSLFLEYKFIDITYDEATDNDSTQDFYFAGIRWNTTEKLSVMLKVGYQERDFTEREDRDTNNITYDLQVSYKYSEKTGLILSSYFTNEETDSTVATDKDVMGITLSYNQEFSEKITGSLDLNYEDADYSQTIVTERDEQTFRIRPALQYEIQEWMRVEVAYEYEDVQSTQDIFEYTTNTLLVGLNFAL